MNYLSSGGAFLIEALLGLYIICMLIRFWMHFTHADFRNPIGQSLLLITNPVIYPFRQFISTNKSFAYATLIASIALMAIKLFLITSLTRGIPSIPYVLVVAIAHTIQHCIYILIFAIIIRAISSWFMPHGGYNPALAIVGAISEPILRQARKLLPNLGGLDLSPVFVIIFLQFTDHVLVNALLDLGRSI